MLSQPCLAEFKSEKVTTAQFEKMKAAHVVATEPPFSYERLRMLTLSYYDFKGVEHIDGKMVVFDAAADYVLTIFKTLHAKKFPFHKIRLMDHYDGVDERSLDDNNTSCFNSRAIAVPGLKKLSLHAYGLAIDINPVQNPFVLFDEKTGKAEYHPTASVQFANRKQKRPNRPARPGMVEEVIDVFSENGFNVWGGDWDTPIDYQHFQVSRSIAELLSTMDVKTAKYFFKKHVNFYNAHHKDLSRELLRHLIAETGEQKSLAEFYKQAPQRFEEQLKKLIT